MSPLPARRGLVKALHAAGEARAALAGLRSSHKLLLLVGGSLVTELLFAVALGLFAAAFRAAAL